MVGVGYLLVGGAHDGNRVRGDEDIAIGGHFAAVDDSVDDAVVDSHHYAFAGTHGDFYSSGGADLPGPGSRGVDHHVGVDGDGFVSDEVAAQGASDA